MTPVDKLCLCNVIPRGTTNKDMQKDILKRYNQNRILKNVQVNYRNREKNKQTNELEKTNRKQEITRQTLALIYQ